MTRDARNLRRRAYNHNRTIRTRPTSKALRMMRTHRAEAVVSHLALALTAEVAA